jgi:hypothetical protein
MLSEKRKKDEKEIFSEHLTAGQTSGVLFSVPKQDDLSVLTTCPQYFTAVQKG